MFLPSLDNENEFLKCISLQSINKYCIAIKINKNNNNNINKLFIYLSIFNIPIIYWKKGIKKNKKSWFFYSVVFYKYIDISFYFSLDLYLSIEKKNWFILIYKFIFTKLEKL
jgi:hypothetical protein